MDPIVEIARHCSYKSYQGINMYYYKNVNLFHTRSDGEFDDALNDMGGIQDGEEESIHAIRSRINGVLNTQSILQAFREYLNERRNQRYQEDLEKAEDMILN